MFWNFKVMAAFAAVILVTVSMCYADIQEFEASWMTGKTVATSYLTLERYSKIRCVEKCNAEGKHGRCIVAAFNKATKVCRLSMDSQQDVVDTPDDSSGVYIFIDKNCLHYLLPNVTDNLITASSFVPSNDHSPPRARLFTQRQESGGIIYVSAWVADVQNQDQYIQADFSRVMNVTGIVTQSRALSFPHWVSSYKFLYSLDCVQFLHYNNTNSNSNMIFPGNTYRSEELVVNYLPWPVRARCVRINPWTWNEYIALRFDVLGCTE